MFFAGNFGLPEEGSGMEACPFEVDIFQKYVFRPCAPVVELAVSEVCFGGSCELEAQAIYAISVKTCAPKICSTPKYCSLFCVGRPASSRTLCHSPALSSLPFLLIEESSFFEIDGPEISSFLKFGFFKMSRPLEMGD